MLYDPNNKGKCNKETGMCEMPMGVIPIGFTKYGKVEPECYNCSILSLNNKCCKKQSEDIAKGLQNLYLNYGFDPLGIFTETGEIDQEQLSPDYTDIISNNEKIFSDNGLKSKYTSKPQF